MKSLVWRSIRQVAQCARPAAGVAAVRRRALWRSPLRARHVVVANQDSDALTVFAFDQERGTLGEIVQQQPSGTPMSIAFAVT